MLSKNEASKVRSEFWTTFGKLMSFVPSQWDPKVNWINYNTGIKYIQFRMNVKNKEAYVGIEISHPDQAIRLLFFEQFEEFKTLFEGTLQEKWIWEPSSKNEANQSISKIYTVLSDVSIFRKEDWQDIFGFLKQRIVAFDNFWENAQDILKDLSS